MQSERLKKKYDKKVMKIIENKIFNLYPDFGRKIMEIRT